MVRALTVEAKNQIFRHFAELGRSPEEVLRDLFYDDESRCSLRHLHKVRNLCLRNSAAALRWRDSTPYYPGRPRALLPQHADRLSEIVEEKKTRYLRSVMTLFNREMYGDDAPTQGISTSTVRRTIIRLDLTRKAIERRHMELDNEKRLAMYERVKHIPPIFLVDTDEMSARPSSFFQRRGWSKRGRDAIYTQICINGHSYSVLASYTPHGVICWKIFVDESINSEKYIDYIENTLAPVLQVGAFGLIDNARIHKTTDALASTEMVFKGLYAFSAPYANMDKPVELLFANVKSFLREHEDEAVVQPLLWINRAFEKYSIRGESAHVAAGHFNMYRRNHEFYVSHL